jgi:hypothetical protein
MGSTQKKELRRDKLIEIDKFIVVQYIYIVYVVFPTIASIKFPKGTLQYLQRGSYAPPLAKGVTPLITTMLSTEPDKDRSIQVT